MRIDPAIAAMRQWRERDGIAPVFAEIEHCGDGTPFEIVHTSFFLTSQALLSVE
ncbi:hypothetical protein GRI89_07520 [Altererythrobacter salegens]|uniref:Uncharacterized protein n=1 Tax=Croceibacterium salegens TaxID=1737568 RepID=A0A6I4SV59_9SPHN|nr:hypothetical protein [Croceibacterium salegens]MXO59388.1 hypothetical protein [Croceibacterium salegens]